MVNANAGNSKYLTNENIRVEFNDRGISNLEDQKAGKKFLFVSDEFGLEIDGVVIKSESLKVQGIEEKENELVFSFTRTPYQINVVYELKNGWDFISKQVLITSETKKDFHVNHLDIWKGELKDAPLNYYIPRTTHPHLKTGDYGIFLRFADATGLFMLVQNPFLKVSSEGKIYSITYAPDMDWKMEYGAFASDRGCLGTYQLSGERVSARLIPEWTWTKGIIPVTADEQDWAEVEAFTRCVQAFVLPHPERSVKMNAAWCENDYQIDVSTPAGREEYKRIIDCSAELGLEYILYAPTISELGSRAETADDWNWENLLWLGLGIKIRKGEWDPRTDPIPAPIQEMLDYAGSKNIKLVAYMYPVMPFEGNPAWIVEGCPYHKKKRNASLGYREFQDYLLDKLVTFYKRTGLGGYAYDYTFLWYDKPSRYAQWWGWRRIKESLRQQFPDIVIDGRQLDMEYGPWIWLAGSYPHPTAADEQPESFNPFPDLHFDRVSANRQRYTAYRYRVSDYCPPELVPGFITHQTSRLEGDTPMDSENDKKKDPVVLRLDAFRTRDWDYLGWKYSLFSSIACAGFNNVVDMIPARDMEEYKNFSEGDKKFIRDWLKWTDDNRKYLLKTKPIIGQPAIGRVDGTSAILDDHGYLFLFNPNGRQMAAEFIMDKSIGLEKPGKYILKEIFPFENRLIGKPGQGVWGYGDAVSILMEGTSALVLKLEPVNEAIKKPLLFNVLGQSQISGNKVVLNNLKGEIGKTVPGMIMLPERSEIKKLQVNGKEVSFVLNNNLVSFTLSFKGLPFSHMQQVDSYDPGFTGGVIKSVIRVPQRIFTQLSERKKSWPIPWTEEDYKNTHLVPERLLLFVQIAEVKEDMNVQFKVDGQTVELKKAYSSIRRHPRCFVGFYTDVTLVQPEREYAIELSLPPLKPGQYQGLFFENVETEYTDLLDK